MGGGALQDLSWLMAPRGRSAFVAGLWASWSAFDEAAVYTGQHPTAYPDFQDLSSPVPAARPARGCRHLRPPPQAAPQHTCSAAPPRSSASPKLSLGSGLVSGVQSYSQTRLTIPAGQKGGWWGGRGPQVPGMLREAPPAPPPPHTCTDRDLLHY